MLSGIGKRVRPFAPTLDNPFQPCRRRGVSARIHGKSFDHNLNGKPGIFSRTYGKASQVHLARASEDESNPSSKDSAEFGYTRKDVLLIGAGLIAAGYALYYGAQALGVEATAAGNYVQLFIFLVICVGYISTYIFRVANKDMTYAKQLEAYEERVMQKRLEEMPETERERLLEEVRREGSNRKGR